MASGSGACSASREAVRSLSPDGRFDRLGRPASGVVDSNPARSNTGRASSCCELKDRCQGPRRHGRVCSPRRSRSDPQRTTDQALFTQVAWTAHRRRRLRPNGPHQPGYRTNRPHIPWGLQRGGVLHPECSRRRRPGHCRDLVEPASSSARRTRDFVARGSWGAVTGRGVDHEPIVCAPSSRRGVVARNAVVSADIVLPRLSRLHDRGGRSNSVSG